MRAPLSLGLLMLAGGCAPPPDVALKPALAAPGWRSGASPGSTSLDTAWAAFGSPELEALVARAREANADIAQARARVVQARGQLGLARAEGRPSVSASGAAGLFSGGANRRFTANDRSAGLDLSLDPDLSGGVRAGRRAALAREAVSRFDRDAVILTIESDVARAYVANAALSSRLALTERALGNARELDRIIGVRVREGAASRIEAGLQAVEVRQLEAETSRLSQARARARTAMAILVGAEAPAFDLEQADLGTLTTPAFNPGQPAALLVRRPDIRAAEARIGAADGDVDRARAAFLPQLRLSAGSLLGLGSGGPLGMALSGASGLVAPIFAGGRFKGNLTSAGGAQVEAVERYRKTLLVALGEVEDAQGDLARSDERVALLTDTVDTARTTARLTRRQYVEGAADLRAVLDAERGALTVENARALAVQDRLEAAIDLYRALGGRPEGGI